MKPTKVIFKMEGDSVVACFPEIIGTDSPFTCLCYSQLGQHGIGDVSYFARLKPATPEQYASLLADLEKIGYPLRVVRKFTSQHFAERAKQ